MHTALCYTHQMDMGYMHTTTVLDEGRAEGPEGAGGRGRGPSVMTTDLMDVQVSRGGQDSPTHRSSPLRTRLPHRSPPPPPPQATAPKLQPPS